MPSESIWKKQSAVLQQDANKISILKEQINKEAEIDASVQLSIEDKIQNLKKNACLLAKKLQNEKHKNQELQTIINHMKNKMETGKLQEASFRDNINAQNLASLENKYKKLEYDLGQVNTKTNRLSQNVEKKRSKISQNRTERVIDSGIFRNIEKELIESELRFKKLLIEKVRYQKEYQKFVQQYRQLKEKAEKYALRDGQKAKSTHEMNQSHVKNIQFKQKNDLNKFKKIQNVRQTKGRSVTIKCTQQINYEQQKEVVCVKKFLSQTGLESSTELFFLFQNVDQMNEKYFNEINNYIDQATQIEKYLADSKQSNKVKVNSFSSSQVDASDKRLKTKKLYKQKKEQLITHNEDLQKELQSFINFFESQNFNLFVKQLDVQLPPLKEENYLNYQTLTQTLQLIQNQIQHFLVANSTQDRNTTSKTRNTDNLQQMINQAKKNQDFLKVMKKEEFQEQYHKIAKNLTQKVSGSRQNMKKKSLIAKK